MQVPGSTGVVIGQEKGRECSCGCKKKEGVLKEVKQQGQGKGRKKCNKCFRSRVGVGDVKSATTTKIGLGCKMRREMNIALH